MSNFLNAVKKKVHSIFTAAKGKTKKFLAEGKGKCQSICSAGKGKFNFLKKKPLLRTVLISVFALLLISSITLAWYINSVKLQGMEFFTGNIDYNVYVFDATLRKQVEVSSADYDESQYNNSPLITVKNAGVGTSDAAYIVVESTGSLSMQYQLSFIVDGKNLQSQIYLGGYKYKINDVTSYVNFADGKLEILENCAPGKINDELVSIDKHIQSGLIDYEKENATRYHVYRIDILLDHINTEYVSFDGGIDIQFNIKATQLGGDFDNNELSGEIYYCASEEDIDNVCKGAIPGATIKLSNTFDYYGDLVFSKPVNLETGDFTLTVHGNLIYEYDLGNALKLDVGGLGKIKVVCTNQGAGGNIQIKAPYGNVTLIGSNASDGDIWVEKNIIIDATNDFGSAGVYFNEIRIVDAEYTSTLKTIQLESNTRATVSFGTSIGGFQAVAKAQYIEITNNGVVGEINLSNMALVARLEDDASSKMYSPQIYVLNNNILEKTIILPYWSVKYRVADDGSCSGNTKIVESPTGSGTAVSNSDKYNNDDIEKESKDSLVEQIKEGNDTRLKIYYQDLEGQTTSIQWILEDYLQSRSTKIYEVVELQIISIGSKTISSQDIAYMKSNTMLALTHLDMQRANMTGNKLPDSAFVGEPSNRFVSLILPQSLTAIGSNAFSGVKISSIIVIPSGVTNFGSGWFANGNYVQFASSVPVAAATNGLSNVKAIFVEEAYISNYKAVYTTFANKIYPVSVMDQSQQHFIRNTKNDEWEITYYISGEDPIIGENVFIDGAKLKVTSIYDYAYYHNYTGTKVALADTVVNLGAGNFYNNTKVVEADLNVLKYLGDDAFNGASNLAKVTFGNFLETIGANAFKNCGSLQQEVILPNTMQKIGASAFYSTKITAIDAGGTTSIDAQAFYACKNLIWADLPYVKTASENGSNFIFAYCEKLVSIKMPALVKASGAYMFTGCESLREVYMAAKDDGLTLGSLTFTGCDKSKLKLYVPEEVLAFYQSNRPGGMDAAMIYAQGEKMEKELVNGFDIGKYIVGKNSNGTYTLITSNIDYTDSLVIPASYNEKEITEIGTNAFRNQNFTNVTLTIGNNITTIGNAAFYGRSGLIQVEFGDSLEKIGSSTFAECLNMVQHVELPTSLESIGSEAFRNTGILSVNTGGAKSIETRAFTRCASLASAIMPEVTVIAESGINEVFSYCSRLVSVDMPKVAKVNGSYMFLYCSSLCELYMGSSDPNISLGTSPFSVTQVKLFVPEDLVTLYRGRNIVNANKVYPRGEKLGDWAINDVVIGDYIMLENGNGYTLVTSNLPFDGNEIIPNSFNGRPITEIYTNAFRNQSFTNVNLTLGSNMKVIGDSAFYGLTGLKSVVMDQVTTIGADAFYGSGIQALNAPKLTSVGNNAFRKCASLEIVSVPKIENIESTFVFAECTILKSVYFENVKTLHQYTFNSDKQLEKITINRQINANGSNMPATMTIDAAAPCTIYVPYRALSAYGSTWSGKPVVSFDVSATNNGNTYILAENNGRYVLIGFEPEAAVTSLALPATVLTAEGSYVPIYSIQAGAFSTVADTLKNLTLSSSVAQLDGAALGECVVLENILVDSNNMYFTSVNGVLYSPDAKMLVKYPAGRSGSFDMTAESYASTVGIAAGAFANATKLTQIVFPESLLVIDSTAFEGCNQLRTVTFTGNTPPTLMGSGIFNTAVSGFSMVIPTSDSNVVTAYLCAFNFGEYEPYINLNGNAAPDANTVRNQVFLENPNAQENSYALLPPSTEDEEDEEELPEDEETTGE